MTRPVFIKSKPVRDTVRPGLAQMTLPSTPPAIITKPSKPSLFAKTFGGLKALAVGLAGAGALTIAAPYALPEHQPMEKRCEVAYNLHAAYYAKPPATPADKQLYAAADANLAECLK